MAIKGIIFDLGSTLMYLDGEWEEVHARNIANLQAFLEAEGLEVEGEALYREFQRQRERDYQMALATRVEYLAQWTLKEALARLGYPGLDGRLLSEGTRVLFQYEEAKWTPFPDAQPTLEALKGAGYHLGLISNASDDAFIRRILNRLGLEPYLDPALNSAGVGIRKPAPLIFQLVLKAWGLRPDEVVMVGDTLRADILGARLVGMRGVLALMDENPANDEWRDRIIPDATIETLAQLPQLLAAWQTEGS